MRGLRILDWARTWQEAGWATQANSHLTLAPSYLFGDRHHSW